VTRLLLAALLAYVPAAGSLLRKAAERAQALGKAKEVTLTGTLTVTGEAPRGAQLVLRFPLQCTLAGAEGVALQMVQLACPLLTFRSVPKEKEADNAIRNAALAAGVDLAAPSSISRLSDRAVYVVGAGPRDLSRPQLWLYKDSHAPARLIAKEGTDLRLLQYGNPAALDWFPRVVELWNAGQLAARFEVLEAKGTRTSGEEEEDDSGQ